VNRTTKPVLQARPVASRVIALLRDFVSLQTTATEPAGVHELNHPDVLVAYAGRHGVLPLLHHLFETDGVRCSSHTIRAACWAAYESNRDHSDRARAQFQELFALLQRNGIKCFAHKGPALSQLLYPDPSLRVYSDLDLLVNKEQLFAACDALEAVGYVPYSRIALEQRKRFLEAGLQYDMKLSHPERPMLVELHWRTDALYYTEDLACEGLYKNALTAESSGQVVQQLPKRDLMFALLIHGTKHQWSRLAWLLDIALLAPELDDGDWVWLAQQASARGCQTRVLIGLGVVGSLFPFPVLPKFEWSAVALARASKIADAIERALRNSADLPELGWFAQFCDDLRCNDTRTQSVRQIARLVFTPNLRDWDRVGSHPLAMWASFPSRVFHALLRRGKRLIRSA
jgi:Uncharacterised nucleotidyltransferase